MKPNNKTTTPSRTAEKRNLPKRSNSSVGRSSTSGMGLRSVSTGMLCQAVNFSFYLIKRLNQYEFLNHRVIPNPIQIIQVDNEVEL